MIWHLPVPEVLCVLKTLISMGPKKAANVLPLCILDLPKRDYIWLPIRKQDKEQYSSDTHEAFSRHGGTSAGSRMMLFTCPLPSSGGVYVALNNVSSVDVWAVVQANQPSQASIKDNNISTWASDQIIY